MIEAYMVGITSEFEGEDIEARYSIYEDQELLCKKSIMMDYKKPAIVGQVALGRLLKELEEHSKKEIVIIMNDPALYEVIRGTSTTKNQDVLKKLRETRKKLQKFKNIDVKDVSGNHRELVKWNEILKP